MVTTLHFEVFAGAVLIQKKGDFHFLGEMDFLNADF